MPIDRVAAMKTDQEQPKAPRIMKSFKLSEECVSLLSELATKLGINYTAVVESAVRRMAKEEKLR